MLEEPEENRLDQSLRDVFNDYELPPAAPVWTGIEKRLANLPPPVLPRRRRRLVPLPLLFGLVALLAGLGGWLLPHPARPTSPGSVAGHGSAATPAQRQTLVVSADVPATPRNVPVFSADVPATRHSVPAFSTDVLTTKRNVPTSPADAPEMTVNVFAADIPQMPANGSKLSPTTGQTEGNGTESLLPAGIDALTAARSTAADAVPASLQPLVMLTRRVEAAPSIIVAAEAARTQQIANLRGQRAELLRLQLHTDSLLVVLGDVPVVVPTAAIAPAASPADTASARPLAHRWSLLLTAAPEQNALTLQGNEADSLTMLRRGHETGRAGFNGALMAEYHLNQRLSVGAGLGYNTYGAELRLTNRHTEVSVDYDTTFTHTSTAFTSTHQTYSIRIVPVPHLNPIFNSNGQVLGYDTVYTTRQDTVFTTTVQHDSINTTSKTVTPFITKRDVTTSQLLRPDYRFLTLPVLLRYRITPGNGRWWTDVALGAQLQFFLGGTQAVTTDGVSYRTEKVSVGSGPFRALNVALSGSLALNYALSERLSVSVAPSLRWQALSVYKAETGLRQQPTATGLQFGVRWKL
jgi:hypothetical protein